MNLFKFSLFFGLLLLFVVSAKAQEDRTRIGFGVGVGMNSPLGSPDDGNFSVLSMPASFANFTFVVRGKSFRFEPNFGFFNYSQTEEGTYEGTTFSAEQTISNWRVGAVIAYATTIASMKLYYGINIGIILSSYSSEETGEDSEDNSKTDFFVGPAIGGEYMFSDNFSLGGEIQINYVSIGQYDPDLPSGVTYDVSESVITTNGVVMLRWYIN